MYGDGRGYEDIRWAVLREWGVDMRIFGEQFYRGGAGIRGYLVDTCMGTGGDMRILGGQFYGNGAWI